MIHYIGQINHQENYPTGYVQEMILKNIIKVPYMINIKIKIKIWTIWYAQTTLRIYISKIIKIPIFLRWQWFKYTKKRVYITKVI